MTASALRGPYCTWLVRRTLVAELVLFLVAFAVSAVTDEGGVPFAARLGRALPLVPVSAALATLVVLLGARRRGEEGALAALGLAPAALSLVCALAATTLPAVAAAAITAGRVDVGGFFPSPPTAPTFRDTGDTFVSEELGVGVKRDGELAPSGVPAKGPAEHTLPPHAHGAAAATTLLAGFALALSTARGRSSAGLGAVLPAGITLVATLVMFQLASAGKIGAPLATLPALALLLFEVLAYRREL